MKACRFCGTGVGKDDIFSADVHQSCEDEWDRRVDNFQCVCCGNIFSEADYKGLGEGDVSHKQCTEFVDYTY